MKRALFVMSNNVIYSMIDTPGLSDGLEHDVAKLENELKAFKSLSQS